MFGEEALKEKMFTANSEGNLLFSNLLLFYRHDKSKHYQFLN